MREEWENLPPKAARYVEMIEEWQDDNGGFRRLPPRAWNVPLSNWVQFCRTAYRKGTLGHDIGAALLELGVSMECATAAVQPPPAAYEKASKAIDMIEGSADVDDTCLNDPFVSEWIREMQDLAAKRPASPLLDDLRDMIPDVFFTYIAPFLGQKQGPPALGRGTDAVLTAIAAFFKRRRRAPDIRSPDELERQLASWMIRWEHDLVGEHALASAREDLQHELLGELTTIIAAEGPEQRLEQWHWWSMCALSALANPEVGNRWHALVYKPPLSRWVRKTGIDPTKNWSERTQKDKAKGAIASSWAVHVALSAAMRHSNETQKAVLDQQREEEEFLVGRGWVYSRKQRGHKRGLSGPH